MMELRYLEWMPAAGMPMASPSGGCTVRARPALGLVGPCLTRALVFALSYLN